MIDPDLCYPNNAVSAIAATLPSIDDRIVVTDRPPRPEDKNFTIGVYPYDWRPVEGTQELSARQPYLGRYSILVHTHVKHASQAEGLRLHSALAARVRHHLYHDDSLIAALRSLGPITLGSGVREVYKRHGLVDQQFVNGGDSAANVFQSLANAWLETATESL